MKHKVCVLLIMLLGYALAIYQFLFNRSLWLDEAKLGLNIVEKSYSELTQPLHSNQVAPILFLWIEKFFSQLIGENEFGLRLFPLIAFFCSVILVYKVIQLLSKNNLISLLVLSLFCISPLIIYFSSEVKQYALDLVVLLLLYYLFLRPYKTTQRKNIILSLAGIVCLFLSNITIIIFFVLGLYMLLFDMKKFKSSIVVFSTWFVGFIFYYLLFIHNHPTTGAMLSYWDFAFIPQNPLSIEFWLWLKNTNRMIFNDLLRFQSTYKIYLGISLLFLFGLASLIYKKKYRILFLITMPILLHLGLSYFRLYPFHSRIIFYQIPLYLIAISFAMHTIVSYIKFRYKYNWLLILAIIPFLLSARQLSKLFPFEKEEVKPIYSFLMSFIESDDQVYVYGGNVDAFLFYSKIGFLKINNKIFYGESHREDYSKHKAEIDKIQGTIWFLVSHDFIDIQNDYKSEATYIINYAKSKGTLLKETHAKNSAAYLIELKK